MVRNLKILMAAALALAAFGAFNVVSAHAAEEKFHCEVTNCKFTLKKDGTGATAHFVYVVKNQKGESISFTCEQVTGEGTSVTQTFESITFTGLQYDGCKSVLGSSTVDFNSCDYKFTSKGGGTDTATVTVECTKAGDGIEITNQGCNVKVTPRGPLSGIGYHNVGLNGKGEVETGLKQEVTVTAKVPVGTISMFGSCGTFDLTSTPITAEFTTANTIVTAETSAGVMVNGWWE